MNEVVRIEVQPTFDVLSIIGVSHMVDNQTQYVVYGIMPRFWREKTNSQMNSSKERFFDEVVLSQEPPIRLLKQLETVELVPLESKLLNKIFKKVRKQIKQSNDDILSLSEDTDVIEESSHINMSADSSIVLESIYRLCKFYQDEKEEDVFRSKDGEYSLGKNGLPFFLFRAFVSELRQHMRELRRSYRFVREEVGAVRGRITRRGMVNIKAKPSSRIECEFETFDISAPIYKVLKTTLEMISKFDVSKLGALQFLQDELVDIKRQSNQLRNILQDLPVYSVNEAIRECQKLQRRIPRTFRMYEKALQYAEHILRQEAMLRDPLHKDDSQYWWHISAPTSKVWEKLLYKSFEKIEGGIIRDQKDLLFEGPWVNNQVTSRKNNKELDLSFQKGNDILLFDAKYTTFEKTPKSNYQYQMHFYADAYVQQKLEENENLQSIYLLHPYIKQRTPSNDIPKPKRSDFEQEERLRRSKESPIVKFGSFEVPFPQCHEIQGGLEQYFTETSEHLRKWFFGEENDCEVVRTSNRTAIEMREFLLSQVWGEGIYHKYLLVDQTRSHGKDVQHSIIWGQDKKDPDDNTRILHRKLEPVPFESVKNNEIVPRYLKERSVQKERTENSAEVFTPLWIVKKQNDQLDEEIDNLGEYVKKTWLEITCGEAPYIVNRYDMETGEIIPFEERQGFLDRKLRRINRELNDLSDWQLHVEWAFKASYGFEWNGDSLLLARENLLGAYLDYFVEKWKVLPKKVFIDSIVKIISYNLFQMDGLTNNIPLLTKTNSETKPQGQLSILFDKEPVETVMIEEPIPVLIMNWTTEKMEQFRSED